MLKNEQKELRFDVSVNLDELIKKYEDQNEALEKILRSRLFSEKETNVDDQKQIKNKK